MRFSASMVLVTMLGWIGASAAHNIQLKAHSRECFHEKLHKDDIMTVTFQVGDREFGGSGNLEIDFWVRAILHFSVGFFFSLSLCTKKYLLTLVVFHNV
jgi:emp24/gp25L/p24 family/GOLD